MSTIQNDPELNGKYLGTITKDFAEVSDFLKESAYQVCKRGISNYPVFLFSKTTSAVGMLLISKEERDIQWNVYISFLEEFVQRRLVDEDQQETFIQAYKNSDEFCCLFIVDPDFTNFVFIPYPED